MGFFYYNDDHRDQGEADVGNQGSMMMSPEVAGAHNHHHHHLHQQSFLIPPPSNLGFSNSSVNSDQTYSTSTTTTGCLIAEAVNDINHAAEEIVTPTCSMTPTTTTTATAGSGSDSMTCDSDQILSVIEVTHHNGSASTSAYYSGGGGGFISTGQGQGSVSNGGGHFFATSNASSLGQYSSTATTAPMFGEDDDESVDALGLEDDDEDEEDEDENNRNGQLSGQSGSQTKVTGKIMLNGHDQSSDVMPLDLSPVEGSSSTTTNTDLAAVQNLHQKSVGETTKKLKAPKNSK